MAAPGKFENQNDRFSNLFISDTNAFIGKIANNVYCKHRYFLVFVEVPLKPDFTPALCLGFESVGSVV